MIRVRALLLVGLWLGLGMSSFAQGEEPTFSHYSSEDGLSQGIVYACLQDRSGFMWFGTQDGLNRFDGFEFKVYRHDPKNPQGLGDNYIYDLFEDASGALWIATFRGGLDRLDPERMGFTHFTDENGSGLPNKMVTSLRAVDEHQLWVGTAKGLAWVDPLATKPQFHTPAVEQQQAVDGLCVSRSGQIWTGHFDSITLWQDADRAQPKRRVFPLNSERDGYSKAWVSELFEDRDGTIWAGTERGLWRYDGDNDHFVQVPLDLGVDEVFTIKSILEDEQGRLWLTTIGEGLVCLEQGRARIFRHSSEDPRGLSSNSLWSLFIDRQQGLWIGSYGSGLNRMRLAGPQFANMGQRRGALSHPQVSAFAEDGSGGLWVGTLGGGVNYRPAGSTRFQTFRHEANQPDTLIDDHVTALLVDPHNQLWVGTRNHGISVLDLGGDLTSNSFRHHQANGQPGGLPQNWILSFHMDRQERIWIGSMGALVRYERETGQFQQLNPKMPGNSDFVYFSSVVQSRSGYPWIGTRGYGLWRGAGDGSLDTESPLTRVAAPQTGPYIWHLAEGPHDLIWVASGQGLVAVEPESMQVVEQFDLDSGLLNDQVRAVTFDEHGLVWASSNKGLVRIDPATDRVWTFDVSDGLQGNEFIEGSVLRSTDGRIYFGGIRGYTTFLPERVAENPAPPLLAMLDISMDGTSRKELGTFFSIPWDVRRLEFTFAAMHYDVPRRNRVAYHLDGFSSEWRDVPYPGRHLQFTNLGAGQYRLRLKAYSKDGVASEAPVTQSFEIARAPWLTPWAFLLYGILLFSGPWILLRIKQRKLEQAEALNQRLRQADRLKDEFMANTSHELRTPLNGIIGLTESIRDGSVGAVTEKVRGQLDLIHGSAQQLLNLINDILDFSILKNQRMRLFKGRVDLVTVADSVIELLRPKAEQKGLLLENRIQAAPFVIADESRVTQILLNLVGNAIKYTNTGRVTLLLSEEGEQVVISVVDTGIGISRDKLSRIFESFEQVDGSIERVHGGSGLGLAITRELVNLHGGTIRVSSNEGQGSCFTFTLPIAGEDVALANQATRESQSGKPSSRPLEATPANNVGHAGPTLLDHDSILVVDDDAINRQVLLNLLTPRFGNVVTAASGKEALQTLENGRVALVLLDIMMPIMSGFEVCRIIRETHSPLEMPIIFLTARSRTEDVVQGFDLGGNDYLIKPFEKAVLMARVTNHLALAKAMRDLKLKNKELKEQAEVLARTQRELVIQERMANIGTMVAGITHEVNNPTSFTHLRAQSLAVDLKEFRELLLSLVDEGDDEATGMLDTRLAPLKEHVDAILEGTTRIVEILHNLRTYSQGRPNEKKETSLAACVETTVSIVRSQYREQVNFVVKRKDPLNIFCCPAEMNQVFINLTINACHAIQQKQRQQGTQEKGTLMIDCFRTEKEGVVVFEDSGTGIPEEVVAKIFEPYFTTKSKDKGSGLGLAISRDIIEQHGGHLDVVSTPGLGSSFSVYLPLKGATP